jgi:uncharacterized repeat protein (TIGR01451 family)
MNVPRILLVGMILGVPAVAGGSMPPPLPQPQPGFGPPQILFVQLSGPGGARALVFQGAPEGRDFVIPVTLGLRPGYIYRVQLTDFPKHPGVSLFPTIEVRGTVSYPPDRQAHFDPVPIRFSSEDIDRVLAGSFLTKVYYLENTGKALGIVSKSDEPLEFEVRPGRDPLEEARTLGRPLLVVRLGERPVEREEMVLGGIAGTIHSPGDQGMAPASAPPCLPWACWPVYDPILGPRLAAEECLYDGGDDGLPAGIGPDGRLHGLDPADTVAEYSDSKGKRHVAISNRVCLFAPRYSVLRLEAAPGNYQAVTALAGSEATMGQTTLRLRQGLRENLKLAAAEAMLAEKKASETEASQGMVRIDQFAELALATGRINGIEVVGVCPPRPPGPDRPLVLCKWSDQQAVRIGEVVTFYLKYTNQGGQPITGVVVSDSLTSRLEYVAGSNQADRDATFTTQENEAGSVVLQWAISGTLLPGQSGMVRFQARVR